MEDAETGSGNEITHAFFDSFIHLYPPYKITIVITHSGDN